MANDLELRTYVAGLADAMPPGTVRDDWVERVALALDAIRAAREVLANASERHDTDHAEGGAR